MFSFPVLRTRLSVCFLSSLLASLPQLFHQCFPFALAFGLSPFNPFPFVRFSSGSYYSAFCSSFPSLLGSASQLLSRCLSPLSLPQFPLSLQPDFSCFPSRFPYSAFCLFPFVPPGFAPTAVPPVLPFCFRFRAFPFRSVSFRPLLFRFLLLSLCFFLSSFFPFPPSQRVFFGAASLPFSFLAFPLPFHLVSHVSLPFLRTRLSVCFFSSLSASLPQLFHRCFPLALAFGLSPLFRFLSSTSVWF